MVITRSILTLLPFLLAVGCGPSEEDLQHRADGRATVEALRAEAEAQDAALRAALSSVDVEGLPACDASGLARDESTTGSQPTNYVEVSRGSIDRVRVPAATALRRELTRAEALLDDPEEPFRWVNGQRMAEELRATFSERSGYDLVLVADAPPLEVAGVETFVASDVEGVLVGWDCRNRAIVCGSAFIAPPPGRVDVRASDVSADLRRRLTYAVRRAAFTAAGWSEVEPTDWGEPGLF